MTTEKTSKACEPTLKAVEGTKELNDIANEFLEKVRPLVETRNRIKENTKELTLLLKEVLLKLNVLATLKGANAEQEAKVLGMLERELNR